jgi:hypothetical protein
MNLIATESFFPSPFTTVNTAHIWKHESTLARAAASSGATWVKASGWTWKSGLRQEIHTVTGAFTTHGHTVTVSVLGFDFEAVVYFAAAEDFTRNVLGRSGWLDRVRLGIVYHDSEVYLSRYE